MSERYDVVILGLAVTSSWGNGHATTYRGLIKGLAARGHRVLFLERDAEWYAGNRDMPHPAGARTELYQAFEDLPGRFEREISEARLVIVGSFVPEGIRVGEWALAVARGTTAFYDIDTPVTMAKLADGSCDYVSPELIRRYQLYLSFTGGPLLRHIESHHGSPMARALYCSVDPEQYLPIQQSTRWDLGYLGTYSDDRQPALDELMLHPARLWRRGRFMVAGPLYPKSIAWPANVRREIHLSPREHPAFYASQRFTLNVTRAAMKLAGYSPSVRLFEAGACGTPVISDWWDGLDTLLTPGREVLIASKADDSLRLMTDLPEEQRLAIGEAARRRILAEHTPLQRAAQLESHWKEAHDNLSAHSSRRDRRSGQADGGMGAGMASEHAGHPPGGATGRASGEPPDSGCVHEPAGAGR